MGCQNGQHFCHASNSDICFENVHMWWHSTCKLYSFVVGIPHWMWWPNWKLFSCWAGVMPLQNQCWEKSQENSHKKKLRKKLGEKWEISQEKKWECGKISLSQNILWLIKDVVPKKKNSLFRYPHPSIIFLLFAPYSDMWHVFSAVLTDLVLQF